MAAFESQMTAREVLEIERTYSTRLSVPARVRRTVEALAASDRAEQGRLSLGRCTFGECGARRCSGCGVPLKGGR